MAGLGATFGPIRTAGPDDVVVIGGGVIGVCAAYYLVASGRRVTLIEKGEICSGCSYGNAGLIVPSHIVPLASPAALAHGLRWLLDAESPLYIRPRASRELASWLWAFRSASRMSHVRRAMPVLRDLHRASLALYEDLAALDGFWFGFRRDGMLTVFQTPQGFEDGAREARLVAEAGIPAQVLDGAGVVTLEPSLRPTVAGGVFYPGDAHLMPDMFVTGLARLAGEQGVRVRAATEVLGFRTRGRRIVAVETTRGDLACDQVVLAAGAWSGDLARGLGLHLPIQPAKGYSVTCARPARSPAMPLMLGEARVGVTPLGGVLRFAGTLELAGLDLGINRRRVDVIMRAATRYLEVDALSVQEIWRGLRPCMPDGLPVIGRAPRLENLIVATGHGTLGVSLGPVTGKIVAQLVVGEDPVVDPAPLRPGRFAGA